jgi:hypothetical protein
LDFETKTLMDALDAIVGGIAPVDGVYLARHCGGYVEDDFLAGEPWRPCPVHNVPTIWDGPQ